MPPEWTAKSPFERDFFADMHGDPADRIIVATALTGHTLAGV